MNRPCTFALLLLSLALTACGARTGYDVKSYLNCKATVEGQQYSAYMKGIGLAAGTCQKKIGNCRGDRVPYAPQFLSDLRCEKFKDGKRETWTVTDDSSCQREEITMNIDKEAKTGELIIDGQSHPMECSGSTNIRDEEYGD